MSNEEILRHVGDALQNLENIELEELHADLQVAVIDAHVKLMNLYFSLEMIEEEN